jgi:hypothetical protein
MVKDGVGRRPYRSPDEPLVPQISGWIRECGYHCRVVTPTSMAPEQWQLRTIA